MTAKRYPELHRADHRRRAASAVLGSTISVVLLLALYYALPLDRPLAPVDWLVFGAGLLVVALLIAWDVRAIARSHLPRLRAAQAVATGLTLLIVLYAGTYAVIAADQPESFSEELSRTDALYFTVTVFATVGFGDIVPRTDLARVVTTSQMLVGLTALGVIAKLLLGAVEVAVRRRAADEEHPRS
ncbi:potassium channel family protein [Pseudonocardia broussonetiae]|uniref:Two pore domain potassium channel family protein n=1 Tax=Pseudonocardia broussonetiae TaxID=2736640 RepID=A0A6M6JIV3_9PSEU|nr:potassium channel family protein [Pseudonocardia broussonetiae]QJY47968.1 two pore domain potassium channel family protein [Pseudonocardia broussonetiae]